MTTPTWPGPSAHEPMRHVTLRHRRGWARIEAAAACLLGVFVFALTVSALVIVVLGTAARFWSWVTGQGFFELGLWDLAPGGAAAFGLATVAISFVGAFWWFWVGAEARILGEIGAIPFPEQPRSQVLNIVEALSIGLGRTPPRVWYCPDPTPNAVSARGRRGGSLCLTTGALELPRHELEALCAHELAHLHADDAHWVTSGMVALARARRFGALLAGLGGFVLVGTGMIWHYFDIGLFSLAAVGALLAVLGTLSRTVLRRLELAVRHHADEIADVAAVMLAKDPASLGALCARLAADPRRVMRVGWRTELMWFEAVEQPDSTRNPAFASNDDDPLSIAGEVALRSRFALGDRAVAAYAEARVPLPPSVRAIR